MLREQRPVGRDTGQHTVRVVERDVLGGLWIPHGSPRLTTVGVQGDPGLHIRLIPERVTADASWSTA
jgi:hypothetical protein